MIPVRAKSAAAWSELAEALRTTRAACDGDSRFIADRDSLSSEDTAVLRRICLGCDLFNACHTFAEAGRPSGGVWAGRRYGGHADAAESTAGDAPDGPGLNEIPAGVSEPRINLDTAADGRAADRSNE